MAKSTTAWTKTRRMNAGAAAIDTPADVRAQRQAHLAEKDRLQRFSEAQARLARAKAAIAAFDRDPLEVEMKAATEALQRIEGEA